MSNFFEWFLRSNSTGARVLRTIVQGVLSVLLSALPDIIGLFHLEPIVQSLVVAALMAVLSPIMAELGKTVEAVNMKKRMAAEDPTAAG